MAKKRLAIRLICIDPPIIEDTDTLRFGLQDKNKQLLKGDKTSSDTLIFEFELDVKQDTDESPNFTGSYAHGSPAERFLYLTLMTLQGDSQAIIKRIKIPLKTITWEQVQVVLDDDTKVLEVKVGGQQSGTVPLLDKGWVIERRKTDT